MSNEERLTRRVSFLEGQLHKATMLATEASDLIRENHELRRRQHWLEQRVSELELQQTTFQQEISAAA